MRIKLKDILYIYSTKTNKQIKKLKFTFECMSDLWSQEPCEHYLQTGCKFQKFF